MSRGTALLDAWLDRVRLETIEDSLDDIEGALEELVDLAVGNRYPGSPGTLRMEIDRESDRAEKAVASLRRAVIELRDERGQAGAA